MPKEESPFNVPSSQQLKKIVVKGKQKKGQKLNIPGSAERLEENDVLSNKFSTYGRKADVAVMKFITELMKNRCLSLK